MSLSKKLENNTNKIARIIPTPLLSKPKNLASGLLSSSDERLNSLNEQTQMDFEDTFSEQFDHPDSPESSDTFGEPEVFPRVGDEYQAAIPTLLTPSEQLKYLSNLCDYQPLVAASHDFMLGLIPVPFYDGAKTMKDEGIKSYDNMDCSMMEPNHFVIECSSASSDKKEPSNKGDSWSEFSVECFLLGLYIFGKNLLKVKRFMEGKEMGQILSFYYGRFYRSAKYQRWADRRKIKGGKCIIGQRLLTGSRQRELLSRLLPHFSEASRNTSVEAYKAFMEGRTSLEEYISTLKSMVGIRALVEVVRVGKDNEDLTTMSMEPSRTNQYSSSRPDRPFGKACSDLTYEEIVKYLSGDFRLSKARSSDLFWEAVWPRLLAKGWHSEKPNGENYRGVKNPLVFVLPGIKKYKRKLLKGDHYFDSISDILKKVASEPQHLVLEEEDGGGSDPENHRYLKPCFSSDAENHIEFTIVDTSSSHEDEPSKVWEMRSLPAPFNRVSPTTSGTHHHSHPLIIDLNVPSEPEANEEGTNVKVEEGDELSQNSSMDIDAHLELEGSKQVLRRHSMRSRPLSTRALEALESGFYDPEVGRKRVQTAEAQDENKSNVCRRARTKTSIPEHIRVV